MNIMLQTRHQGFTVDAATAKPDRREESLHSEFFYQLTQATDIREDEFLTDGLYN